MLFLLELNCRWYCLEGQPPRCLTVQTKNVSQTAVNRLNTSDWALIQRLPTLDLLVGLDDNRLDNDFPLP